MLKKRIIPTLLLNGERMVKGKNFKNYRDTGDPVYAAKIYNSQSVDELIFIDIEATLKNRKPNSNIITKVSEVCFMPLTVGGGVKSLEDISLLLNSGADKVLLNSAVYDNYKFVNEASKKFGSSCIIVGIDIRVEDGNYILYKNSGTIKCDITLAEHLKVLELEGAGEIYINNISNDGLMRGYNLGLTKYVLDHSKLPIISCGGAGNFKHVSDAFIKTEIQALAMSSIFHFGDNNPIRLRSYLKNLNIPIKTI
jgi:cyclase